MAKIKEAIEDFKPDSRLVGMGTTRAEEALASTAGGAATTGDQRPVVRPTTALVTAALRDRFCSPEFAFFQEVGDSGSGSSVFADAVAVNMWASRGYAITGFEVKVSRSDWLRELKQPEKSEPILSRCDYWYLVAPDDVYHADEVPVSWGILSFKDGKLREKRRPPKLEPKPITRAFVAQMFRRGATKENRDIQALVDKAREADRAAMAAQVEEQVKRRTRDLTHEAQKWKQLLETIGCSDWEPPETVIPAVKLVLEAGVVGSYYGVKEVARNLRAATDRVEKALLAVSPTEDIDDDRTGGNTTAVGA